MLLRSWIFLTAACEASFLLCACKSSEPAEECTVAVQDCPCYDDGTCEPGLVCDSDRYCGPGPGQGASATGAGGAGGSGGAGGGGAGSSGCPSGQQRCDGQCVGITDDPLHCGGCTPCAAGQVCQASQCKPNADCTVTPCVGLSYCDLLSKQCKRSEEHT